MIGASIVAILLILTPLINNITKPILKLTRAMKQVSAGNLNMNITIQSKDELEVLGLGFNRMLEDLRGHIQESLENEKIKQQLEIDLLLSQINPHFIYNTLNTVIYLARKQRHQDITEMMTAFIHILQDAVRIGNNEVFSSVEKEVGIIQDYTKIQKYRYRDQFELYLYISDNVSTIDMPKNILQPIIENALFHGILPKETKGMITLSIHLENDRLVVNISDDGVGMTTEAIESMDSNGNAAYSSEGRIRNIGLTNVKKRLELLFGSEYFLAIDSIPQEGTSLTIHIPTKNRSGTMLI
ncbi:HAMP domain-containing protein [Paenibacillus sp. LMG 31458]|uniref:HAMP domain-containing protein n=1 Tax=Paenibacillus phytorum TaxID=2654977 RepID=A0ABX1XYC0_9BACL|nr:histidine kinase [Paenibacillus phytorum]NOU73563.1 HAMP domain-containing protein [Paenibacillus phytorum]